MLLFTLWNGDNVYEYWKSWNIGSHRFKLDLADKLNLKSLKKNIALVDLTINYTWKNIKSEKNNNKSKISAPTWNEPFDLSDSSYTISSIQDYLWIYYQKAWDINR